MPAIVGQSLTIVALRDSDQRTSSIAYQWQRSSNDGATWADILGATSVSYVCQNADNGLLLRASATYSTVYGLKHAYSNPIGPVTGTGAYVMSVDRGLFTFTGLPAGLPLNMPASAGAFTLSGQDATLTYAGGTPATYTLTADYGSFHIYGDPGPSMPASPGIFVLSGQDAVLRYFKMQADFGSFAVSGQAATLTYSGAGGSTTLKDENGVAIFDELGSALLAAA